LPEYSYDPKLQAYTKICPRCDKAHVGFNDEDVSIKLFSNYFSQDKATIDGFYSTCKICVARFMRARRDGRNCDPEKLLEEQEGKCGICEMPLTFDKVGNRVTAYVDHNHSTGDVRGILCVRCNSMLGSKDWVLRALEYLKKYGE